MSFKNFVYEEKGGRFTQNERAQKSICKNNICYENFRSRSLELGISSILMYCDDNGYNNQQMSIHAIIQAKKMQEFDVIQVLFKRSSFFQRFDWYNSHSQGEDVEWKIYITVW